MTRVTGVDGCPGGWVAAEFDGTSVVRVATAAKLPALLEGTSCAAVDIPLGLPLAKGVARPVETHVRRRYLTGRTGSRLFSVLSLAEQQQAAVAGLAIRKWMATKEGPCPPLPSGFTIQGVLIAERIVDIAEWMSVGDPPADVTVEAHPEVSFGFMNGGSPVSESKKTGLGKRIRQQLLLDHGMATAKGGATLADFREVLTITQGVRPGGDDILDAVAVAWTAWRIHTGQAEWSGPGATPAPSRPPLATRQVIWH